jgi:ubiquitin-conjugating enzyme E2 variant
VIGKLVIASFREHHRSPEAMTRHGFLELNGNNCLALVPLLGVAVWLGEPVGNATSFFLHATLAFFALAVFATNQLHCWAHQSRPPRVVGWLQTLGLVLSPQHHARHHAPPHAAAYCVTTGWMNRLLEPLGFFPACERALVALGLPRSRH